MLLPVALVLDVTNDCRRPHIQDKKTRQGRETVEDSPGHLRRRSFTAFPIAFASNASPPKNIQNTTKYRKLGRPLGTVFKDPPAIGALVAPSVSAGEGALDFVRLMESAQAFDIDQNRPRYGSEEPEPVPAHDAEAFDYELRTTVGLEGHLGFGSFIEYSAKALRNSLHTGHAATSIVGDAGPCRPQYRSSRVIGVN